MERGWAGGVPPGGTGVGPGSIAADGANAGELAALHAATAAAALRGGLRPTPMPPGGTGGGGVLVGRGPVHPCQSRSGRDAGGRAPAAVPDGTPTPTRTGGGVLAPLPAKRGAQSRCAAPRHPLARPYAHARTRARTHAYAGHRGVCVGGGGLAR